MKSGGDSMERIVPTALEAGDTTGEATLALHLERYHWAASQLPAGLILDLACGVGYGSVIIAGRDEASRVVGADLSADALGIAAHQYPHPRVRYVRGNGSTWARDARFDGVCSLETIEHVENPEAFVVDLAGVLRPGGILVASVPVTPSVDANPHHRTDFSTASFRVLGARAGLLPIAEFRQVQPFSPVRILTRTERRAKDLRPGLMGYYLRHPLGAWRRALATIRYGFNNHYLTVAWQKPR